VLGVELEGKMKNKKMKILGKELIWDQERGGIGVLIHSQCKIGRIYRIAGV